MGKSWRDVRVIIDTADAEPVPIYPVLAKLWITEAAKLGTVAVKIGRWPAYRVIDYALDLGEYIALLQIGEELVILSLSNINAARCNVNRRTLQVRALEKCDDLREIFAYGGVR